MFGEGTRRPIRDGGGPARGSAGVAACQKRECGALCAAAPKAKPERDCHWCLSHSVRGRPRSHSSVRQRVKRWFNVDPCTERETGSGVAIYRCWRRPARGFVQRGIGGDLTAKLTQLTLDPKLQVVPAPEIRDKGTKLLDDVRHEFGVTMVLQGRICIGSKTICGSTLL